MTGQDYLLSLVTMVLPSLYGKNKVKVNRIGLNARGERGYIIQEEVESVYASQSEIEKRFTKNKLEDDKNFTKLLDYLEKVTFLN